MNSIKWLLLIVMVSCASAPTTRNIRFMGYDFKCTTGVVNQCVGDKPTINNLGYIVLGLEYAAGKICDGKTIHSDTIMIDADHVSVLRFTCE